MDEPDVEALEGCRIERRIKLRRIVVDVVRAILPVRNSDGDGYGGRDGLPHETPF